MDRIADRDGIPRLRGILDLERVRVRDPIHRDLIRRIACRHDKQPWRHPLTYLRHAGSLLIDRRAPGRRPVSRPVLICHCQAKHPATVRALGFCQCNGVLRERAVQTLFGRIESVRRKDLYRL